MNLKDHRPNSATKTMFRKFQGLPVAVTGATGFIGRYLVKRLLEEGARIEVITRDRRRIPHEWQGRVSIVEEDIAKGARRLSPHTEIVFHCAGEIRDPQQFYKTNVEGARNILDMCIRNGIKRLVHLSSVGVIGAEKPGIFDETRPGFPRNDYERSKLEAERLVLETGQKKGLSIAILRPSIVYGPGKPPEKDSFLSLVHSINNGYFRCIGSDKGIYNIVYIGDAVEALLYLAVSPGVEEKKIFIINDAMEWGEFVDCIQSLLHLEHKIGTIPKTLAFCLALGCNLGNILGLKLPFSISRFKALSSKTIFSSERIRKELDFKFLFGNHKGLKNTIDYYRQKHLL